MYKISIIGIDNTGKTAVVNRIEDEYRLETIQLTSFKKCSSKLAKELGSLIEKWIRWSEYKQYQYCTGLLYFLLLIPYKIELWSKRKSSFILSDRDPIIDTLCYSHLYLPDKIARYLCQYFEFFLKRIFHYSDLYIYLVPSPKISVQRMKNSMQLHENLDDLSKLEQCYQFQLKELKSENIEVICIHIDSLTLNQLVAQIKTVILKRINRVGYSNIK